MASRFPINNEYVESVKQLTRERLEWLLEELRDSEFEMAIEKFQQFRNNLADMQLEEFADQSAYPTLPMHRSPLGEWDYTADQAKRIERCRIATYHQAYQDIVGRFRLYYHYRIKKQKQVSTREEIEDKIIELLKPRKVKRGFKRHTIFRWTGTFYD